MDAVVGVSNAGPAPEGRPQRRIHQGHGREEVEQRSHRREALRSSHALLCCKRRRIPARIPVIHIGAWGGDLDPACRGLLLELLLRVALSDGSGFGQVGGIARSSRV